MTQLPFHDILVKVPANSRVPRSVSGVFVYAREITRDDTSEPTEIVITPDAVSNEFTMLQNDHMRMVEGDDFNSLTFINNDPFDKTLVIYAGYGDMRPGAMQIAGSVKMDVAGTLPVEVQNPSLPVEQFGAWTVSLDAGQLPLVVDQGTTPWQVEIAGSAGGLAIDWAGYPGLQAGDAVLAAVDWANYPGWDGTGTLDVNLVSPDPLPVVIDSVTGTLDINGLVQANGSTALHVIAEMAEGAPLSENTSFVDVPANDSAFLVLNAAFASTIKGVHVTVVDPGSNADSDFLLVGLGLSAPFATNVHIPSIKWASFEFEKPITEIGQIKIDNPGPSPVRVMLNLQTQTSIQWTPINGGGSVSV